LGSAISEVRRQVDAQVKLPPGYTMDRGGEYKDYLAAITQLKIIMPLTIILILPILFALYGNLKFDHHVQRSDHPACRGTVSCPADTLLSACLRGSGSWL
jgi:Cu/Ag efflux pump CusA